MEKKDLLRVLIPGGVLSPAELQQIIVMVEALGHSYFYLGSRQDILFPYTENYQEILDKFPEIHLEYASERHFSNIVSSYVAAEILPESSWITSSTYLYILENFDYKPRLKINICDPKQSLVPLFTGHLNYIASETQDFWYLYIRFEDSNGAPILWPVLVNGWDIPAISQKLETLILEEGMQSAEALFDAVNELQGINNHNFSQKPILPVITFPDYEGMNRMANGQYWLGLYWRNNRYDTRFLKALLSFCREKHIGKVCITPWKSIIIKGINNTDKSTCESILGRYGINPRHSSLELNWHLPVLDEEALSLKRYLVRNFDQNDICTQGLTFSIKNSPTQLFTSVVVEKNPPSIYGQKYDLRPTYNILHCKNFNPNNHEYLIYAQDVEKEDLPALLMELTREYYTKFYITSTVESQPSIPISQTKDEVFQCLHCLTIYDPKIGDPLQGIDEGTLFSQLPSTYTCPTCEGVYEDFRKVDFALSGPLFLTPKLLTN